MGFFFSCYGWSYSGHSQIIHWHSCSAGQEQMFSAYPPLFLKQEDEYFGSCGGCYMQGEKFSWQILVFHVCTETAASVQVLDRDGNFEHLSESVYAQTCTHIWFHVSLWEQWPALFIVPICSCILKKIKKTHSGHNLFRDLLVRQVRQSCINVDLENEHRLIFLVWIQARNLCSDRTGEQKWCQSHTAFDWNSWSLYYLQY